MRGTDPGIVARLISASLDNRALVLVAAAFLAWLGFVSMRDTAVDALPDLSDVQVTVRTTFPNQAPQVVEDQVTFPLTSALLGVSGATAVRGYSAQGSSLVTVLFKDGTDRDAARAKVLDTLAQQSPLLPRDARLFLGADATGVGWVYQYALADRSGRHDLAQLRALQDWYLRPELQALDGVAEVATVGGRVRQFEAVLDPPRMQSHQVSLRGVLTAMAASSGESGGGAITMGDTYYPVRADGYVRSVEDLRQVPVRSTASGTVQLADIADVRLGPQATRGIAELDGMGEVVGAIVVMRPGTDTRDLIGSVVSRLAHLKSALPDGVEIVEVYNRAALIDRSIANLSLRLIEEGAIVVLVALLFLGHVRSAGVILVALPLSILGMFTLMRWHGLTANIASLGGIAIAVGAMVDAAIVMVENVHRKLGSAEDSVAARLQLVRLACIEVGPTLVTSLLIIAVSFLPVLALQSQEGRLFAPLAYAKTYAMVAAALVTITVVPVLIYLLVRNPLRGEQELAVNRLLGAAYRPLLEMALRRPRATIAIASVIVLVSAWPAWRLGSEFLPEIDEGDLLYMPVTSPGISPDAMRELLQRTDRLIRMTPEVERVFGKAGQAESSTDPAPIEMIETVIKLKPSRDWRKGLTLSDIRNELDQRLSLPALANAWTAPIRGRIDMVNTGLRVPVGVQVLGPDPEVATSVGAEIANVIAGVPGAETVFVERTGTGRYVQLDLDRSAASHYGLRISDIDEIVQTAVAGTVVAETLDKRERYSIAARYPAEWRDSIARLRALPVVTDTGSLLTLGDVARVRVVNGPSMIRSEDARPSALVIVKVQGRDIGGFVQDAQARVQQASSLPTGYTVRWVGHYQNLERAYARLKLVVPLTLAIIVLMLMLSCRQSRDVLLILLSLPFALVGSMWILWALGFNQSVATIVGLIALAGLAVQTGMVMWLYLDLAWTRRRAAGDVQTLGDLRDAIREGALLRLRPKMMTACAVMGGLLPIMLGAGAGSELLRRVAAPMVGGILSTSLLILIVLPALYFLAHGRDTN